MIESKEYGITQEKGEEKSLPESTQDHGGQENQQLEEAKQEEKAKEEKDNLTYEVENELSGLLSSVENPELGTETGFEDAKGALSMEPLDSYDAVRLDLGKYT